MAAISALYADDLELKPETLACWNEYERAACTAMERQIHSGSFLDFENSREELARLRSGEILVWQACPSNPKRVSSGLIHDWIGAAFFPDARIADVQAVSRDYRHYKEIYKPGILDAQLMRENENQDQFSLLMRNPAFFSKTALDGEFQSNYCHLNDTRMYTITRTLRLQEIDGYGQSAQHKLPPDRGHGYIWRITTLTRLEEKDGGVYVEERVIALSRDVPAGLRWVAGPIIRREARESAAASIQKTRTAVEARPELISANRAASKRSH